MEKPIDDGPMKRDALIAEVGLMVFTGGQVGDPAFDRMLTRIQGELGFTDEQMQTLVDYHVATLDYCNYADTTLDKWWMN